MHFPDHDPRRSVTVSLVRADGTGSTVVEDGSGSIPVLQGGLNPILDTSNRLYLYARNCSINDGSPQPVTFSRCVPLRIEDAQGRRAAVTIVEIIGRTSLVRYDFSTKEGEGRHSTMS
jgi:hypothetical protein